MISSPLRSQEPAPLGALYMAMLALTVGLIAGCGAVVFRGMIGLFHNLFFLGRLSFEYDANVHTPEGPWGPLVILAPVVGAVGVAFLVKTFAPEAKGHGVPEVMDAIYYNRGLIRPVVAAVKSVASALSIGSGGSVGREGPIIQIGAAFGSTLGQVVPMPSRQRVALIAAGAGGGIAATFNTPIGGLAFAVELMMPAINAATLLPVIISTVTATYVGRYFLGMDPSFDVPNLQIPQSHLTDPSGFLSFVVLGLLLGLLATLFVRSIYWAEDRFDAIPGNYYTRHMLGMFAVGLMMYALFAARGRYYIQGVGYATIMDVLSENLKVVWLLLLLVVLKLAATCLTLGSGASGGVFSPCLFLGATFGGAFGVVMNATFPDFGVPAAAFAIAGMAAMVAGTTGAVVTSIAMLFEMTRAYATILPLMVTVAVAYVVRKKLSPPSIYTLKLLRRGHVVPEGLQAALDAAREAQHMMSKRFQVRLSGVVAHIAADAPTVVLGSGTALGVAPADASDTVDDRVIIVRPDDGLLHVLASLEAAGANWAIVSKHSAALTPDSIVGVITTQEIAATARATAQAVE